ncbi:hypothetical protein J6590_001558 [Homalodisca vitripennis]|nr:hypothetical protein J6590_001558 [Homalodisca vitripennis]
MVKLKSKSTYYEPQASQKPRTEQMQRASAADGCGVKLLRRWAGETGTLSAGRPLEAYSSVFTLARTREARSNYKMSSDERSPRPLEANMRCQCTGRLASLWTLGVLACTSDRSHPDGMCSASVSTPVAAQELAPAVDAALPD